MKVMGRDISITVWAALGFVLGAAGGLLFSLIF